MATLGSTVVNGTLSVLGKILINGEEVASISDLN